jgi:transposase
LRNKTLIKRSDDVSITSLIKRLLGVKGIVIEDIKIEDDGKGECLVVRARNDKRAGRRCGICGKKSKPYDKGRGFRRWRSLDLGTLRIFIEAPSPRVRCEEHGVVASKVPWARHGSWFTHSFEQTVAWLTLHGSRKVVSELMRVSWNTVGAIVKRVHDGVKEKAPDMFEGLESIGIDETSYKKGHKYMTVVVDHGTGKLIWAAKGHGKTVLDGFFGALAPEQKSGIKHVTADGAGWIADCVKECCPNAKRCIDPFHVVQWAAEALDAVRREAWREACGEAASGGKRKPGRPKKGEGPSLKDKAAEIKNSRYALLKNPESLTGKQEATVEMIAISNKKLYRAYLLKEKLRLLFKLPLDEAKAELKGWVGWAMRSRIPGFVELQRKIKRHADAILSSIEHGLSNARVEAINNKIKLTVRMGYGFRNIDNLIALVMLRCSNVSLTLPGRA